MKLELNNKTLIRANFTNRGFAKVIAAPAALNISTPDKASLVNIASVLGQVKVDRPAAPKFKTIEEFLGLDYVGYIVEKERLDKQSGEWVRTDEYRIIGAEASSFVDTRIAYGQSYRYRIKSVLKVSKTETKPVLSQLEALEDIKLFESKKIQLALNKNQAVLEDLNKVTNLGLTSKVSTGVQGKDIALIKDLSLRVDAGSTSIAQSPVIKNENNRILQNLRVSDLSLARGTSSDLELQKFINTNLQNFKEQKVEHYSYYFESNPTRNWIYVDVVENTPPPPPQTIKIVPNSPWKKISIYWLKPANDQRDIKSYKVYRRNKIGEPWSLIASLPENTPFYEDFAIGFGQAYIYALACVDVHGTESFLSVQIEATLNENYALEKQEKKLKWISGSGTRPDEVRFVIKKFLNRTEQIVARKNFTVAPTTKFAETQKSLIIKVTSLDTHQTQEIKVVLKNINTKE